MPCAGLSTPHHCPVPAPKAALSHGWEEAQSSTLSLPVGFHRENSISAYL